MYRIYEFPNDPASKDQPIPPTWTTLLSLETPIHQLLWTWRKDDVEVYGPAFPEGDPGPNFLVWYGILGGGFNPSEKY